MSAFKRKSTPLDAALPPSNGSRVSAYNGVPLLSLGVASLDDLFGGGLPVGGLLLIEEDAGSSYARLLLKFWTAQGLVWEDQRVVVIGHKLAEEADSCSGFCNSLPGLEDVKQDNKPKEEIEEENAATPMKIAFRYDGLKKFQTTVEHKGSAGEYCSAFDVSKTLHLDENMKKRLHCVEIEDSEPEILYDNLFEDIRSVLKANQGRTTRIAIHSLANTLWHDCTEDSTRHIFRFLLRLKVLLRENNASAVVTFPASTYKESIIGHTALHRIRHACDAVIELESFATKPHLAAQLPRYSGILHVHALPLMGTLLPASTKLSVLRGLAPGSNATAGAGGMDNNLAFRLKRRRFVIETLHLDIGGGENERQVPAAIQHEHSHSPANVPETSDVPEVLPKVDVAARPSKIRFGATPKPSTNKTSSDW